VSSTKVKFWEFWGIVETGFLQVGFVDVQPTASKYRSLLITVTLHSVLQQIVCHNVNVSVTE